MKPDSVPRDGVGLAGSLAVQLLRGRCGSNSSIAPTGGAGPCGRYLLQAMPSGPHAEAGAKRLEFRVSGEYFACRTVAR